jgi:drug/metabolite transporter (DMT)-like permease
MSRIMSRSAWFQPAHVQELALLLLLSTLWGASYAFIRVGVETIPPVTLIATRTAIAAAVLLGVLKWRGVALPVEPALWRRFLLQACLNSVVPFTLIAWAEQYIDAGLAAILNASAPIFVFVLARSCQGSRAASARQLAGVALAMGGTLLIVGVQALSAIDTQLMAELAIVAATACYAGAAIYGANFRGIDPMLPAAGSLVCGATLLVPVSVIADQPWTLHPSLRSIAALLCLAILSTALALTLYFRLIRTLGPVGASSQAYLRVPIGVAIGAALLDEPLAATTSFGLVLVIGGVAAMTLPAARDGAAPARTQDAKVESPSGAGRAAAIIPPRRCRSRPSPSASP